MKRTIVFVTVFFISAMSYAQQVVVMIPPFTLIEGVSRTEADTITRVFLGRLSATGAVTIINTANLQQRMAAMKWEQSDWSSNEKKSKLNEGFNAKYLIIGTISNLFGDTIIDITAEDMNTFVVVGSADVSLQRGVSPNEKINELVTGIVQTMTSRNIARGGSTATVQPSTKSPVVQKSPSIVTPSQKSPSIVIPRSKKTDTAISHACAALIKALPGQTGSVIVLKISSSDKSISEYVVRELEYQLGNSGKIRIKGSDQRDKLQKESNIYDTSDAIDDNLAIAIGRGVDIVIHGHISGSGSLWYLKIKAIDVKTKEIVAVVDEKI